MSPGTRTLLSFLLGLRAIMLIGSAGAMIGALLMFFQGGFYLYEAWHTLMTPGEAAERPVTVPVLEAVDAFLFGIVLVIFAYGIAIGFVFTLPETVGKSLPNWMKIEGRQPAQGHPVRSRHRRLDRDLRPRRGRGERPSAMVDAGAAGLDPDDRLALRMIELAGGKGGPNADGGRRALMTQPGSAYPLEKREEKPETHTMTVLVDNEPGVLARVIGLFSGRGYNIESLTVSETEHEAHLSRITIVTSGPPMVIEQIQHQLERLVPVHSVTDLTVKGNPARARARHGQGRRQGREAGRGACAWPKPSAPQVIDASTGHFVFEITGKQSKIEQFIALMQPLGLVEVARTGLAAISRGPERM